VFYSFLIGLLSDCCFKGEEQSMLPLYALACFFLYFVASRNGCALAAIAKATMQRVVSERKRSCTAQLQLILERLVTKQSDLEHRKRSELELAVVDLINAIGAAVSFVVLIVIAVTKFTHGAWA
jgi:hypothetical protein